MKNWLKISIWTVFLGSVISVLIITENTQNDKVMEEPDIDILVQGEDAFLNEDEVMLRLQHAHLIHENQKSSELDIEKIEAFIQSITQVKATKVYQLIGGRWIIEIELRKPIARIFNKYGEDYYVDDEGNAMLTTRVHTAHVVVVTGDIPDRKNSISVDQIINNDSLRSIRRLDDIYRISDYVCKDPLFRSLIGQMQVEKNGDFVLVPLVGDQKIVFGSAYSEKEVSDKFKKLKIFYEEAMPYEGWDKYSEISLKYKDQIVCKAVEQSAE